MLVLDHEAVTSEDGSVTSIKYKFLHDNYKDVVFEIVGDYTFGEDPETGDATLQYDYNVLSVTVKGSPIDLGSVPEEDRENYKKACDEFALGALKGVYQSLVSLAENYKKNTEQ